MMRTGLLTQQNPESAGPDMANTDTLDDLRQQIDKIDAELHRLILERTDIVMQVRTAKGNRGGPVMRPAREAAIMRQLLSRHHGPFPVAPLIRIWREMIGAFTQLQGTFRLAVWAPGDGSGLRGSGRDHFGSAVPLQAMTTPQSVVRALGEKTAEIGLLPIPGNDPEDDAWWVVLVRQEMQEIHIIGQLPVVTQPTQPQRAWIIGRQSPEPTGADETVLCVTTAEKISRDRLQQLLSGLGPTYRLIGQPANGPMGTVMYLVAVDGFLTADDPAILHLVQDSERQIEACAVLGSYAKPIDEQGNVI